MTISAADQKTFALTDEIIDHVPVQPASLFTGNFLTIVAASTAFAALYLLTVDAGELFAHALALHDYETCVRLTALYAPIYFLMFGAASYLATRYGLFARTDKYINRKHEACFERIYGRHAPSLAILVPSYKEEAEVIRQTLLSAALVEYPQKRVVLLLDDPPYSMNADDQRKRSAAHNVISELTSLLREPAEKLKSEQAFFQERLSHGLWDPTFEASHLARLYAEVSHWVQQQAESFLQGRSTKQLTCADRFFVENILRAPARSFELKSRSLLTSKSDVDFGIEYRRLASLFDVTLSVFERKKYANLSHAANKAMNLNSYIGLMGKQFIEVQQTGGLWLYCASEAATLSVPGADYIINLDADTLLLSDYALRLVDIMEEPGNERLAVAQTPYSAYPDPPSMLERIAGATTDVQYLTHQGMTFFGATAWVGANALIRHSALADIMRYSHERSHCLSMYIEDNTLIEDTAASIDLINKGWRLYNYPARLAFSATPPDFGSLLIQRRRWSNGGLLIFPNLVRYVFQTPPSFRRLAGGFVWTNYLLSPAFISVAMIILLICSFDDNMFSIWVPLAAIPYQIVYCCDLKIAGYRRRDLLRVYALNMMLIPVYLGGTLQSLRQAFTGTKTSFVRTPKVAGRTSTQLFYLQSLYGILFWCLFVFAKDVAGGRVFHMVFTALNSAAYLYGIIRFIGLRESWEDLSAYVKLLSTKRAVSIGEAKSSSRESGTLQPGRVQ
jgi:cellulose synthase/poly-beta-1,6-N-acetylglucosamine synthase-like glycosyltransferase